MSALKVKVFKIEARHTSSMEDAINLWLHGSVEIVRIFEHNGYLLFIYRKKIPAFFPQKPAPTKANSGGQSIG
jgi:hypothetical protein